MSNKLLEGIVDAAPARDYAAELRDANAEIARLQGEFRKGFDLVNEKDQEIDQLKRIIGNLRQVLNPLHKAMRIIYGEIDLAQLNDEQPAATTSSAAPVSSAKTAIWESWKQKLPGAKASVIGALLEHGELSVEQLCVMTHISRKQTIYDATNALKKLHLINADGNGRYQLKNI